MLVHDCVMLEIPVDPFRLFEMDNPDFAIWLGRGIVERVRRTTREQHERHEAEMRRAKSGGR